MLLALRSARCGGRARSGAAGAAGSSNRIKSPTPESFDGSFNFCRSLFSGSSMGDGGGWYGRLPARRHQPLDPAVRAHQDAQSARTPSGEPNHLVVRLTDPELFQCPFIMMTEVGSAYFSPEEAREAARVPAEGRLPVGRRLLGQLRLGALGVRVQQGAAARRVPDARPAAGSSALPARSSRSRKVPQIPSINHWAGSGGTSERGDDSAVPHALGVADARAG